MTTSSPASGRSAGFRSSTARRTAAARSSGRIPASAPRYRPIGVRHASTTNTSAMGSAPVVEALAGLLAELAAGDLFPQQRRRLEAGPEGGGQMLGDGQADVEADQIG